MWSESFEPFAIIGDNFFFVLILILNMLIHLLKSFDNDILSLKKKKTNAKGKRNNDIDNSLDDSFKKPMKTAKIINLGTSTVSKSSNSFKILNVNEDISSHDSAENTGTVPEDLRCVLFYVTATQNWRQIANKTNDLAEWKVFKGVQGSLHKTVS